MLLLLCLDKVPVHSSCIQVPETLQLGHRIIITINIAYFAHETEREWVNVTVAFLQQSQLGWAVCPARLSYARRDALLSAQLSLTRVSRLIISILTLEHHLQVCNLWKYSLSRWLGRASTRGHSLQLAWRLTKRSWQQQQEGEKALCGDQI